MFYEIPSWLYYLGLSEILVLVAYTLAFTLVESLLLLAFACLFSLVLPGRVFRQYFVAQGSLLVAVVCLAALAIQRRLGWLAEMETWQIIVYPIIFLVTLMCLAFISRLVLDRSARLQKFFLLLGDRISVFTYIYVPPSLLSLGVVILRNLS